MFLGDDVMFWDATRRASQTLCDSTGCGVSDNLCIIFFAPLLCLALAYGLRSWLFTALE